MPIISPAHDFYSFTVKKRFGRPNSLGNAIFGWSSFGDYDWRADIYQKRYKRSDYWTKTHQPKKGIVYIRERYYYSVGPRTPLQQSYRNKFGDGVRAWQSLTNSQKSVYNDLAKYKPYSGYNKFITDWLKSH
jgi:hypothetical protein